MADNSKQYEAAMKSLNALIKKQEALKRATDSVKDSWNAISTEVFKMSGAEWFKKVPKSKEELEKIRKEIKSIQDETNVLGEKFAEALNQDDKIKELRDEISESFKEQKEKLEAIRTDYDISYEERNRLEKELTRQVADNLRSGRKEFQAYSDEQLLSLANILATEGDITDAAKQLSEEQRQILGSLSDQEGTFNEINSRIRESQAAIQELNKELSETDKEVFSVSKGLLAWSTVVYKMGISALMDFDKTLNEVQRDTGAMMDENSAAFGDLTGKVAQYGMSVEQAGQYMKAMSDELKTTDFNTLAKATKDFAAIEGATGASAENITGIAGELMRMGMSSGQVKDYMEGASKMAQKFGVSSKRAIDAISRNIKNIRTMGFKGGEESLQKMVMTAEKLNMNVDEIFDVAKKARTIEGAMEMASELQLAGGSFANINPMDLLAAARNGPEELQKILTKMGGDIGKFNAETGKYEFDAVDVDRLQMVADATGQTLDSVQNMIQANAENAAKTDPFKGYLGSLNEADKMVAESVLGDMLIRNPDGTLSVNADNDMAKKMGIDSLEDINGDMITQMIAGKKEDTKNLEEQNKRNQAFQDSITNFYNALVSVFTVFQPILEFLTSVMQGAAKIFAELPGWGKWIVASLFIAFGMFGTSVGAFIARGVMSFAQSVLGFGKNILSVFGKGGIASLGDKIKGAFAGKAKDATTDVASKAKGPSPTVGAGLTSLAEGLKAMGKNFGEVVKGIAAVALAGPAFLLFVPALPGLLVMAGVGMAGKMVAAGFKAIADGLINLGANFGEVMKGVAAMAIMAVPMIIFLGALPGLLVMALIGAAAGLIVPGFEALSKGLGVLGENFSAVLKGSAAMAIIGLALLPFAFALSMMADVSWSAVLASLLFMVVAAGIVLLMGALLAGPQALLLLAGAAAMLIIAGALLVFALAMQQMLPVMTAMQDMDFSWLASLGWNLLLAAPGLFYGGLALLLATPGLIYGSLGLMAISLAALVASQVDWSVVSGMGNSLLMASAGLIAFSFAALMFANPLAIAGLFIMIMAIAALAAVMVPLSLSLQLGSDSMTKFAIGLERLSAAADTLSEEKLAKLQKISEAMAKASAAGNVAAATAANAEGAGAGAGGGGTRKIEVDVKLNGRELQNYIVKDTQIAK